MFRTSRVLYGMVYDDIMGLIVPLSQLEHVHTRRREYNISFLRLHGHDMYIYADLTTDLFCSVLDKEFC